MSGCEQVQQAAPLFLRSHAIDKFESDLVEAFWRTVEAMVCAVQRLPAPRLSEYPAFRRDHWRMGRPLVRN